MTLYYTNPSLYLTEKQPPALVIEAPREFNPWINLWANPRLASFQGNLTVYSGTANGTVASGASGSVVPSHQIMAINLFPDYSFVEQVENFRELEFGENKSQIQGETEEPKKLPNQVNYLASFGNLNQNET